MTFLLNIFGNVKSLFMAAFAIFGGLYIAKQKYNAYKAEDKLKTLETKIAKTNVIIAKKKAQAEAQSKEIETKAEVQVLEELKEQSKTIEKEMIDIEKEIEKAKSKKIKIEV